MHNSNRAIKNPLIRGKNNNYCKFIYESQIYLGLFLYKILSNMYLLERNNIIENKNRVWQQIAIHD